MRLQHANNEVRGTFLLVDGFDFRLAASNQPTVVWGRKWSTVTLRMSEIDISTMSATWTRNGQTTPTTMFVGSVSWPSVYPQSKAGSWGKHVAFPFQGVWFYSGKRAMLSDYVFSGGRLDRRTVPNFVQWNATAGLPYHLDAVVSQTQSYCVSTDVTPSHPSCADSKATATRARSFAIALVNERVAPSERGSMLVTFGSEGTAAEQMVVHAIGTGGVTNGVGIGARCNKLYIDLAKPFLLTVERASKSSKSSFGFEAPWQESFRGTNLWIQSAWQDSKLGLFSLTAAGLLIVDPPRLLDRWTVYSAAPDSLVGVGPFASPNELLYRVSYR